MKKKSYNVVKRSAKPNGGSTEHIKCPFCQDVFMVYVWSFCGCGKKCPSCGAHHTSDGYAVLATDHGGGHEEHARGT